MNDNYSVAKRFQNHINAFSMSVGSSANLSGIVGSEYVHAQQDIEAALLRNVNDIIGSRGRRIDRISEIVNLVESLVDQKETAERKLRIANDKIVDLELSGVVSPGQNEGLLSAQILHAQLQRRESDLAEAVDEIERLTEELETTREEERNTLAVASKERDRLAFLYSEKDKAVSEFEKKIDDLTSELKKKDNQLSLKDREVRDVEAKLGEISSEALSEIDIVKKEKTKRIRELEKQLEETETENFKIQENLKIRSTILEREIEKLTTELKERKSTQVGNIVSIQEKVEISAMMDECARQRRRVAELETAAQRQKSELETMKSRISEIEDSKDRMAEAKNEAIRQLEAQNQEILGRLGTVTSEKKALVLDRDDRANTVQSLIADTELLQDIMTALRSQAQQISAENSKLKFRLETKEKEISRLRENSQESTLNNARTRLEHAELELVEVTAEKQKLAESLHEANHKIRSLSNALEASVVDRATLAGVSETLRADGVKKLNELENVRRDLLRKIASLEQALATSDVKKGALEMRLKALESEASRHHQLAPVVEDSGILDEILVALAGVRDAVKHEHSQAGSKLAAAESKVASLHATIREKEKQIAELQEESRQGAIVAPAILLDDDDSGIAEATILQQEIEIACTELRSVIDSAGWPLSVDEENLESLVSVVKANVLAVEDSYNNQLREIELDVEYLRAQVETERMVAEDSVQVMRLAAERSSRFAVEENNKRKVLQESALELAAKTTVLWNKYRAASTGPGATLILPPFSK